MYEMTRLYLINNNFSLELFSTFNLLMRALCSILKSIIMDAPFINSFLSGSIKYIIVVPGGECFTFYW